MFTSELHYCKFVITLKIHSTALATCFLHYHLNKLDKTEEEKKGRVREEGNFTQEKFKCEYLHNRINTKLCSNLLECRDMRVPKIIYDGEKEKNGNVICEI